MPRLPSTSAIVDQRPSPGSGSNTDRRNASTPRSRAARTAAGTMSTPSTGTPRRPSAAAMRPGPQPTSSVGPVQRRSKPSSPGRCSLVHASTMNGRACPRSSRTTMSCGLPERRCANPLAVEARRRRRGCTHAAPSTAREVNVSANLLPDAARATARASAAVSTSRSVVVDVTRRPRADNASRVSRAVWLVDIGTPRTRFGRTRVPQPQQPPPAVRRRPEHGVDAGARARPTASSRCRGVSCGVSMPTSRLGIPGTAVSAKAAAIRSSRPAAALRQHRRG